MTRPYRPCPDFRAWRKAHPTATAEQRESARRAMHVPQETAPERSARLREEAAERRREYLARRAA